VYNQISTLHLFTFLLPLTVNSSFTRIVVLELMLQLSRNSPIRTTSQIAGALRRRQHSTTQTRSATTAVLPRSVLVSPRVLSSSSPSGMTMMRRCFGSTLITLLVGILRCQVLIVERAQRPRALPQMSRNLLLAHT